ncbi:MAG: endonuclease III [Piscirickettsiaceae bacterium]|nr:endonuclease III [Piscirickettsiaceae bacterium]
MNNEQRHEFFSILRDNNPKPTTDLNYDSPFELLISVILSAQATDVNVNKATDKLYSNANTPENILALGEDKLKSYIRNIGLFRKKSIYIIKTCSQLIKLHNSNVPGNRKDLESLPGVGRKTANVILNIVFKHPVIAVDTHIFRLANRTGLAKSKTVYTVEDQLTKSISKTFIDNAHHWLIWHGRHICKARNPLCKQCAVSHVCDYHNNKQEHSRS